VTGLGSSLSQLAALPVIGILRRCPPDGVEAIAGAAIDAGFQALEVTFDSAEPARQIRTIRAAFPEVAVGAGTVLERDDLGEAAGAGAAFVVTPVVDEELIAACAALGLPSLPGAATATEVWRAHRAGATAVKVFPAEQLGGPAYLRALRAPLGGVELVPTGGVDAANARNYLEAGAVALGVGSSVFDPAAMRDGDATAVGRAAAAFVEVLR
jgi:2-dehydro-3-deoxyphosphogluconate aldolase / (4S)-4-hydroxy-2-oxoglutarate aldolase